MLTALSASHRDKTIGSRSRANVGKARLNSCCVQGVLGTHCPSLKLSGVMPGAECSNSLNCQRALNDRTGRQSPCLNDRGKRTNQGAERQPHWAADQSAAFARCFSIRIVRSAPW